MPIIQIRRDFNDEPNIVRILTDDSQATVATAGYLTDEADNLAVINNGAWTWEDSDLVLVYSTLDLAPAVLYTLSSDLTSLELYSTAGNGAVTLPVVAGNLAMFDGTLGALEDSGIAASDVMTNALASAHLFVGSAGNVATDVAVTGDIAISNAGVTSIAAGAIVNADVNAAAAIDYSKLAALTSGNILVGSAGNVATSVALSGDATIIASGALTIANDAITTAKILDANVTLAKLAAGITPSHIIKFAAQHTTVGGAADEAIVVTGAAATDLAFVQLVDDGTNNVSVLSAVVTLNTLTVTFSGNPGNDAIINYQIIRAAA